MRFLPWLQDFTLYGVPYGEPRCGRRSTPPRRSGITGFMLWNPNVRYHADALTPIP